jgi:ketosteroid isomerase-like protein
MDIRYIRIFVPLLLSLTMMIAAARQEKLSAALSTLVAAERAFAKLASEKGVREAFITYFADDGINFQPHPTNTKEAYSKRPESPTPLANTLVWAPIYGGVSQAGDLGYTTGPYVLEEHGQHKQSKRHGMFFSVWKKQPDGNWRVALDLGIQTDSPASPLDARFIPARTSKAKSSESRERQLEEISALDQIAFGWASKTKEFLELADQDLRLYRQRKMPFIGKEAVRVWLYGEPSKDEVTLKTIGTDIANSGDLAYSYGSYEISHRDSGNATIEKGYYARIWKRDDNEKWRIAFDVTLPIPKEEK